MRILPPELSICPGKGGGIMLTGTGTPGTNYILQAAATLPARFYRVPRP